MMLCSNPKKRLVERRRHQAIHNAACRSFMKNDVTIQREYYERISVNFDKMHLHAGDAHELALSPFSGLVHRFPHDSSLDVGAGTGRASAFLTQRCPNSRVVGIEPFPAQPAQAYAKRLSPNVLIEGD